MAKSSKKRSKKTVKRTGLHGALVPLNRLLQRLSKETGIKAPKRRNATAGPKKAKKTAKKGKGEPSAAQLRARRKFAAMARSGALARKRKRAKR